MYILPCDRLPSASLLIALSLPFYYIGYLPTVLEEMIRAINGNLKPKHSTNFWKYKVTFNLNFFFELEQFIHDESRLFKDLFSSYDPTQAAVYTLGLFIRWPCYKLIFFKTFFRLFQKGYCGDKGVLQQAKTVVFLVFSLEKLNLRNFSISRGKPNDCRKFQFERHISVHEAWTFGWWRYDSTTILLH